MRQFWLNPCVIFFSETVPQILVKPRYLRRALHDSRAAIKDYLEYNLQSQTEKLQQKLKIIRGESRIPHSSPAVGIIS